MPVIEPYTIDGKKYSCCGHRAVKSVLTNAWRKYILIKAVKKSNKSYYIRKGEWTIKANAREEV